MRIKKITELNVYEDVYDLEVPIYHNFLLGAEIVVHNSIDSVRYSLESEMAKRKAKVLNKANYGFN